VGGCNDFDINLTHIYSLASTNTVATVPYRVVHITLLDITPLAARCRLTTAFDALL